jgi:bifunctional non-homologous end joining protein LigD
MASFTRVAWSDRDLVREELPSFIEPMMVNPGPVAEGEEWAVEIKWDGARALLRNDRGEISVRSRAGRDWTSQFAEVTEPHTGLLGHRVLLDGELVCLGEDGKPDFEGLRGRLRAHDEVAVRRVRFASPATLMIFDILHLDGRSTRHLPYERRRELLGELDLHHHAWRVPAHFLADGQLVTATLEQGLEGVVSKRLTSAYVPGPRRTSHWIKTKHRRRDSFIITGWLPSGDDGLESFVLSRRTPDGGLRFAGSAKFDLSRAQRALLRTAMRPPRGRATRIGELGMTFEVDVDYHGRDGALRDPIMRTIRALSATPARKLSARQQ